MRPLLHELALKFTQAVRSVLTQYATFRGRASRSEYWWFFLFSVLLNAVTSIPDMVLDAVAGLNGFTPFGTVAWLALFIPTLAVSVRRLHDSDLSGWWMAANYALWIAGALTIVVAGLVPFDRFLLFATPTPEAMFPPMSASVLLAVAAGALLALAGFVMWLVLMLRTSTPGANRYGPSTSVPPTGTGFAGDSHSYPYGPAGGGLYGPPQDQSPYGAPGPGSPPR